MSHVVLLGAANSVHLQRWAVALQTQGRQVSVVSQQAHLALPLPAGVALHALPVRHGLGYVLNAPALRRLLRRLQPDLLHAHYATGYGLLARLAGFHPLLLSVWGSDVYEFPTLSPLHAWLLRGNLRAADALASTSEAMARQLRALWPQAGPVAITPFGVDLDCFVPAAAKAPSGVLTIGTVKTLAPAYGIDILIDAFALLRARRGVAACRLLIVGDGPQRQALMAMIEAHGLADSVEIKPAVPHGEVPDCLRQLDVFVAASRIESFGVAVVEAMACGVPVVVSDAGGLPEVVGSSGSGVVVPAGSAVALADALQALLQNPAQRQQMGQAGRERACSAYAWPVCVQGMWQCQDAAMALKPRLVS